MYLLEKRFLNVVMLIFLFCAGLRSQYNFSTEWQSPNCDGNISIVQYERTNNTPEIILACESMITVYDGATKNIKYSFQNDGSSFWNFTELFTLYPNQPLDVNNDGVNEFVTGKSESDSLNNIWFVLKVRDGSSGQILFSNTYTEYYGNYYALDIDGDSYTEICVLLHYYDFYTSYSKLVIISTTSQAIGIKGNR